MPRKTKSRSDEPAKNTSPTQVRNASPKAVRSGASRGRSSKLRGSRSPVRRRSIQGQEASTASTTSGNSAPPQNGLGTIVASPIVTSKPGTKRRPPINQPRYQSGWAPLVPSQVSYGPHSQIGLIWTSAPKQ